MSKIIRSQFAFPFAAPPPGGAAPELDVYESAPQNVSPKAAVIVIQEIFGVTEHIRGVCDQYAELGYLAWAPALFDRAEPKAELSYGPEGMAKGRELAGKIGWDAPVADVRALAKLAREKRGLETCVVGFCWGGSVAWLAAQASDEFAAVSSYYGSLAPKRADLAPRSPVILHFGEKDAHIPLADVRALAQARPESPTYVYPADHGFNCTDRPCYDAPSAKLAFDRTVEFFAGKI